MILVALFHAANQMAWSDYRIPFDVPAPTPDSASRLYGVSAVANSASRASVAVRDSALVLVADTIASDSATPTGYDGYTADVEVRIPVHGDRCSYDLRGMEAITFEYRSSEPITGGVTVLLGSDAYPDAADAVGAKYEAKVTEEVNLVSPTDWKTATLSRETFAVPQWASAIEGMPALDSVLRYLEGIRIAPRTTYTRPGTDRDGSACANCTAPTMTKQTLEIRNLTLKMAASGFMVSVLPRRRGYTYEGSSADTALLRAMYGIQAFSNAASRTALSMADGAVVLRDTLASDSGAAGRVGYSAEAGVSLPARHDRVPVDYRMLTSIDFEFRNSDRITDYLSVRLESDVYPDSLVRNGGVFEYAIKGQANLAAGTSWKSATVEISGMNTPSWFRAPEGYPEVADVLANLRGLRFVPKSTYSDGGAYQGVPCTACAVPTMKTQVLEIRNIHLNPGSVDVMPNPVCSDVGTFAGVVRTVARARFAASYREGVLAVETLPGYARIEVVSASGCLVAAFAAGDAGLPVALEPGTWFVVARGPGQPVLVRPIAVTR